MVTLVTKPVVTYMQEAICECGHVMGFTGLCVQTVPISYEHVCPNCGRKAILGRKYPVPFAQTSIDDDMD